MIRYAHAKFAPLDFINKKMRGKRGKPNIPFTKKCCNPCHDEWRSTSSKLKGLATIGGSQHHIRAFQQLSENPTRIGTLFCIDCLQSCGSHRNFTRYLTDDDYTRNSDIKVNKNKTIVNTVALFRFLYLKLLSYSIHSFPAYCSVY